MLSPGREKVGRLQQCAQRPSLEQLYQMHIFEMEKTSDCGGRISLVAINVLSIFSRYDTMGAQALHSPMLIGEFLLLELSPPFHHQIVDAPFVFGDLTISPAAKTCDVLVPDTITHTPTPH